MLHISPTLRFSQRSNLSGNERMNLMRKMPVAVARTTTRGPTMFAPSGVWLQVKKPFMSARRSITMTVAGRLVINPSPGTTGLWISCVQRVDPCAQSVADFVETKFFWCVNASHLRKRSIAIVG